MKQRINIWISKAKNKFVENATHISKNHSTITKIEKRPIYFR